jgi:coproporphyrinogen III oxidase-like Fe-S oxidoreductase
MHPDKIKDAIYRIKDEYPDILICAGFIAGLPHETIETLEETIEWLENSPIDSYSYQTLSIGTKSNMGLDPEKYGYKFDKNGKWYNEHMSWEEANILAETASRGTLSAFTFYSRLRNLDYSPAEVKLITEKDEDEINFRNINKIYSYKEKVLC